MARKLSLVFTLRWVVLSCLSLYHTVSPIPARHKDLKVQKKEADCFDSTIPTTTCGDGFCQCSEELGFATCNGALSEPIHYVPKLPSRTQHLCFVYNNLTSVDDENFFQNVSQISRLDFGHNELVSLHPGTFFLLKNLTHLNLDSNPEITPAAVSVALTTATLKVLDLEDCRLGRMSPSVFQNITLPRLKSLRLPRNEIENLDRNMFASVPQLRHVEIQENRLLHFDVRFVLHVRFLDLSDNNLYEFPETCGAKKTLLFPRLQILWLYDNFISTLPSKICLPQLRELDLSGNDLWIVSTGMMDSSMFPLLTRVAFSDMKSSMFASPSAFVNLTSLREVVLEGVELRMNIEDIFNMFLNCHSVSDLGLHNNYFDTTVPEVRPEKEHFVNLTSLDISSCSVSEVFPETFCLFPHMTDLDLSDNLIYHLPDGAFDCLPHLTHLDLSYNKILVVSSATFSAHIRRQLVNLDLSYNLFQCDCDLLWFQDWMRKSPSLFYKEKYSYYDYDCKNIPGTTVPQFVLNEQACLFSHATNVTIVSVLCLLIIIVTVVVTVCRYHWHLRLLCYEACRGPSHVRRQRLQHGRFDYDVFVSYDSEDLAWVRQHLVPELEGRLGLRLCLHERDFPAGYILDNIVRSVESSKKILMLFSRHFVESRWCQFELSFCLRHAMEYEDDLIVVCLDDVTSHELTSGMMAVLKTTTYLQWVDGNNEDTAYFWRRLAVGLQEIMTGPLAV